MTTRNLEIFCENTQKYYQFHLGTSLKEIYEEIQPELQFDVLAVLVNNEIQDLSYELMKPKRIQFIDVSSLDGHSVYVRSLCFILYKAVLKLYPGIKFKIEQHISNGLYCKLDDRSITISHDDIVHLQEIMQSYVDQDIRFYHDTIETKRAVELFEAKGLSEKTELLLTRKQPYTSVYRLESDIDYSYGVLAYSTGVLKNFKLMQFHQGMLLRFPNRKNPKEILPFIHQEKMFKIHNEFKRWGKILEISNIGDLNRHVESDSIGEIIKVSEALHEKKIAEIADRVCRRKNTTRVILVSGPTSSGKTTFSKRLAIQLQVVGLKPLNISLDNYFVNREDTPLDENGEFDYESVDALDIELFNKDILDLLEGREIRLPKFSFENGKRNYNGSTMKMERKNILIIEGIHGLNPRLTRMLPQQTLFKIFVSAMTSISIDGHNIISSTDNRLIRRLIRDHMFRSYNAIDTLQRWESVLDGENKHIFPYQEEADTMFNSALPYELGVLKFYAEPLLKEIFPLEAEHSKSERLLKFFSYFQMINETEIPPTSILREFLGGSTFRY
jgi:uridine kinase